MPFTKHKDGYYINIKVSTKHHSNKIGEIITVNNKKYLKICITAIPYQNSANEALIKLLSEKLDIPKTHITIKAGKTSKTKLIYVSILEDNKINFLK